MIWTAIYEDKTFKVFTTENNSLEEAETKARTLTQSKPYALVKGSQEAHFVKRKTFSGKIDPFNDYTPNDPRNW